MRLIPMLQPLLCHHRAPQRRHHRGHKAILSRRFDPTREAVVVTVAPEDTALLRDTEVDTKSGRWAALVGLGASDQELVDSHPMLLEKTLERLHHHLQLILTQSCCSLQQAVMRVSERPDMHPVVLRQCLDRLRHKPGAWNEP
jgi:hypothetical protein